jgi:hypothetical protein
MSNEDISWETTTSANFGTDINLFNNKLNFTFDWYTRTTFDILVQLPVSAMLGVELPPFQNAAVVKNWGYDFEIQYRETIKDFVYSIGANFSKVDNLVEKYNGDDYSIDGVFIIKEGLPYNSLYGYKHIGIFQTQEEINSSPVQHNTLTSSGDLKYENYNDTDNVIDAKDRQVIGNTIPKYYFGLNLNFKYKSFDLSALIQGVGKVDRYLEGQNVFPFANNDRGMVPIKWINRWTAENTNTDLPRLTVKGDYGWNYAYSTFWVQDGSYLRLKNLQIGYSLPEKILNNICLKKIRFYANAQNLFTLTNYEGYDPETKPNQTNVGYPQLRVMSLGVQINL